MDSELTIPERRRWDYIDALRGWAILLVILIHASQGQYAIHALYQFDPNDRPDIILPTWLRLICDAGGDGVVLFFVLSAISLTFDAKSRIKFDIRAFAVRRFFRIAPMYYLGVALYFWLFGWGPRIWAAGGVTIADVFANLSFTHGFMDNAINSVVPGGWSIAAEAIFYVIFPFAIYYFNRSWRSIPIVLSISIALSISYLLNSFGVFEGGAISQFYFINYVPAFIIGIATGLLLVEKEFEKSRFPDRPQYRSIAKFDISPTSLLLILIIIAPFFAHGIAFATAPDAVVALRVVLTSFVSALLCIRLHRGQGSRTLVVNPLLKRMGIVSFSIYIIHFALLAPIYSILGLAVQSRGVLFFFIYFFLIVLAAFLVANVTYELIERPFIRFSRRLAAKPSLAAVSLAGKRSGIEQRSMGIGDVGRAPDEVL